MRDKIGTIGFALILFISIFSTGAGSSTFLLNDPPYEPSNPNPSNNSVAIDVSTTLSWTGGDPDGDIVTYTLYFGTNPDPPYVTQNIRTTSYNPGRMQYHTQYYWRIVTWDIYGADTSSPIWTFETAENNPPNIPSNPTPANGSTSVDIGTSLSWSGGDPDGDIVTYDIYLGTSSNPPIIKTNNPTTTFNPANLDSNTKYYWRIDAWDSYDNSTTGPVWTFETAENNPPNIPSNPTPANGSTSVVISTILSWSGGDPDEDTVTYNIFLGTTSNPPNIEMYHPSASYQPENLEYDTKYYWRIDAWDEHGYSTTGPTWTFQTGVSSNNPPDQPNRPSGSSTGIIRQSYTYTSSATDPEGDRVYYMFDWDDGSVSSWKGPFNSGEFVSVSHIWLNPGNYNVRVKAKDVYDLESIWSEPQPITMPKNREIYLYNLWLERIILHYPFLESLISSLYK